MGSAWAYSGGLGPSVDVGCVHGVLGSSCIFGAFKGHKAEAARARGIFSGREGTGEDQLMHHAARALKIETIVSYTKNVNSYAHFGINVNSSKHEDI